MRGFGLLRLLVCGDMTGDNNGDATGDITSNIAVNVIPANKSGRCLTKRPCKIMFPANVLVTEAVQDACSR